MRAGLSVSAACIWALCFVETRAHAFECSAVLVCEESPDDCVDIGLTQGWNQRCLTFWVHENDDVFVDDSTRALVVEAFAVWSDPCTDMALIYRGTTDQRAGFDNRDPDLQRNVVLTARNELELGTAGPEVVAIALNSYSPTTGEIFDSDILLNGFAHQFDVVSDPSVCRQQPLPVRPYDIRNTLVHEVGHFLGFDHVNLVDATMFASSETCEVKKQTLEADDLDALCSVYAAGLAVATCSPPPAYSNSEAVRAFRAQCSESDDGCGCRAASGANSAPFLLGLGLVWMVRLRRLRFGR